MSYYLREMETHFGIIVALLEIVEYLLAEERQNSHCHPRQVGPHWVHSRGHET
jgi:hypothetical protein